MVPGGQEQEQRSEQWSGVHHRVQDLQISYSLWSRKPPEGHDRRRFDLAYASVRKEDMTGR